MSLRMSMIALGLVSGLVHAASTGGTPYEVQQKYLRGDPGGWDYLTVGPQTHHLFISRSDRALLVDLRDGAVAATIIATPEVHGVAFAPATGEGFISNACAESVTEFDPKTFNPHASIDVKGRKPAASLDSVVTQNSARTLALHLVVGN